MFEEIFTNQVFDHITENILINLDVKSIWRCRLVCMDLQKFIKSLEKSEKLKKNDFKLIRRICWKKFLAHPNWNAVVDLIRQEDNFYKRRGLIDLLEAYNNQEEILTFDGPIVDSYLNIVYGTSKRLIFFWPYLSNKNPKLKEQNVKEYFTPFHFVACYGLSDVADFMVEEIQENIFDRSENGESILHNLSRNGHSEIIRSLQRKINFEFIDLNLFKTSLHTAIDHGHLNAVKALLENQTSSFKKNLCEMTSYGASGYGHVIPNGLNAVDIAKHLYNKMKYQNHFEIVKFLSSEVVKCNAYPRTITTILYLIQILRCFPWFSENSLLCVILRYTVYVDRIGG